MKALGELIGGIIGSLLNAFIHTLYTLYLEPKVIEICRLQTVKNPIGFAY